MKDKKFLYKLLAITSSFIYEALAAILVGFFIGWGLDYLFGFENPIMRLIFMVVGALAAVRNFMVRVYRLGVKSDD